MLDELVAQQEKLKHVWPLVTLIVSLFTFGIGVLSGHKLALNRDRRKEFNDVSEPVRLKLLKQIAKMDAGEYFHVVISQDEIFRIADRLGKHDRINHLYREYKESTTDSGLSMHTAPGGKRVVSDFTAAHKAAKNLLSAIPRR